MVEADSLPMEPVELAFASLREVEGFAAGRIEFSGEPDALRLLANGDKPDYAAAAAVAIQSKHAKVRAVAMQATPRRCSGHWSLPIDTT